MMVDYDVIVVGGGPVALALVHTLQAKGFTTAVVNSKPLDKTGVFKDNRALGLNNGSRHFFESMGLWDDSAQAMAQPIITTHVSQKGRLGRFCVSAQEMSVEALGYVLPFGRWAEHLWYHASRLDGVKWYEPALLTAYQANPEAVTLTMRHNEQDRQLTASLLVGADGGNSKVRELAGIGTHRYDYGQKAIVVSVTTTRAHEGTAYERFTADGPIAMLPQRDGCCGLVWCLGTDKADHKLALSKPQLLQQAQNAFGNRLGQFVDSGLFSAYPLRYQSANRLIAPRTVIVGNAAQQVHPLAAQGFNLGLRDVASLGEQLAALTARGYDIGHSGALSCYEQKRLYDQKRIQLTCDRAVRIFSNQLPGLSQLRGLGLLINDVLPSRKYRMAYELMK
jgi:2-octaprenyl-6-methoxyphenol hydroxylase